MTTQFEFGAAVLAKVDRENIARNCTPQQQSEWRYPQAYGAMEYYIQSLIERGLNKEGKKLVAAWLAALKE